MKRIYYALLVLALVMLGGSVTLFFSRPQTNANLVNGTGKTKGAETTAPSAIPTTLTITNGVDTKPYLTTVAQGTTALALLDRVASENGITVQKKEFDFGTMVEGIGAVLGDASGFWAFRINDTEALVGAGAYVVQPNDRIEFRFEKL